MAHNLHQKSSWTFQVVLVLYISPVAPISHKETEKQNVQYKPLKTYLKGKWRIYSTTKLS